MKLKLLICVFALSTLYACTATETPEGEGESTQAAIEAAPEATEQEQERDEVEDVGYVPPLNPSSTTTISNEHITISYDDTWELVGQEDDFISLQRVDKSAVVTIRTARNRDTLEHLCNGAAKVFAAEGADITEGPAVNNGVCKLAGIKNESNLMLWLKKDQATGIAYSINFHGHPKVVNQVLSTLQGEPQILELAKLAM